MVLDLLKTAHAARVLGSLARLDGRARFSILRNAAGIGDQQLTRALRFLNANGFVAGHVMAQGDPPPMEYVLTRLGREGLDILHAWQSVVRARSGAAARMADEELEAIVGE